MRATLVILSVCSVLALSSACCTPDQWESDQTALGESADHDRHEVITEFAQISYDAINNRTASVVVDRSGKDVKRFKMLTIYDNHSNVGKLYVMDYIKDTCRTTVLTTPFRRFCVPAEAKRVGNFTMGLSGALKATAYEIPGKGVQTFLSVEEVGNNQCVPVSETLYGTVGQIDIVQVVAFINITPGIKNETVFDIPEKCQKMQEFGLAKGLIREHFIMAI